MPKLVLRKPWTSQPQQPKAVDASLAPKFVISTLGGGPPREYVNGVNGALVGGANTVPSQVGVGQKLDGTSGYVEFASAVPYDLLGAMTLVWHGIINSTSGYNFLAARAAGNGGLINPFELRTDPGGNLNLIRANGTDYSDWITTATVPVGVPVTIVVTHGSDISTSAGASFWINGVSVAFSALRLSTSGGNASGNAQPLRLGTRQDLYAYAATTLGLCAGFDRILPDTLIKSLSSNAWQLFTAEPRRRWATPVAAAGGTTLASSVTATATAAAALSDAVTLAASASAVLATSAALLDGILLNGAATGTATASAALSTGKPLASSITADATATAALTDSVPLAAAALAQATVSANLAGGLAASVTASATASATLANAISLAASVSAVSTSAAGVLDGILLNAAASASATVAAALASGKTIAASTAQAVTASASLTLAHALAAAATGYASATGTFPGGIYVPSPKVFFSPARRVSLSSPSRARPMASPARGVALSSPLR